MKRLVSLTAVTALLLASVAIPLIAKDSKFTLHRDCRIGDIVLKKGRYRLGVTADGQAEISQGGDVVATLAVRVEPIGSSIPNTVEVSRDGELTEVRGKKERFVFETERAGG